MKRLFTLVGSALVAVSAFAQQAEISPAPIFEVERIGVHLVSHHWPDKGESNVNPGVYVSFRAFGIHDLVIGDYRNSLRRNTFYVGKNWEVFTTGRLHGSVITSLGSGYRYPITPILAAAASYDVTEDMSVRLSFIPRVKKYNQTTVLHLSAEYKF